MGGRWSEQEINIMHKHYQNNPIKSFMHLLNNRKIENIICKAQKLGLKQGKIWSKSDLSILLDDSYQTAYWLGFLAADGHFTSRRIYLGVSQKDLHHLIKFKNYVKSTNSYSRLKSCPTECYQICFGGVNSVSKLRNRFNIHDNKTKTPMDLTYFNDKPDLFFCFIIGFIDGDGYVNKRNKNSCRIGIVGHANWKNNFDKFYEFLHSYFNCDITSAYPKVRHLQRKIFNREYITHTSVVNLSIMKTELVIKIHLQAKKFNLPLLERKWNKLILNAT